MFIEYLENAAAKLKEMQEKLNSLDREYRKEFDRQAREEINHVKKEISRKKHEIYEQVYSNLEELRLIKKHFPDLFNIFIEDELIGNALKKKMWLFEFKELQKKDCEKTLHEIRTKRAQLKEARDFLKGWFGKIDAKSLVATWSALKDVLKEEIDKNDALTAIDEHDKRLKKEGWLLVLIDPLILKPLHKFFRMLRKANEEEYEKRTALERTKGRGTLAEYNATKELRNVKKKRMRIERICRHILLANTDFLKKIRKQRMTWRDSISDKFMKTFLEKLETKTIDEKKWIKEMRKKLEV